MLPEVYDLIMAKHTANAMDRIFGSPKARSNPCPDNPALVEGPPPTVDLGTAEVDDSDYDGAPYCSGCRARTQAGCKCGPIAEND